MPGEMIYNYNLLAIITPLSPSRYIHDEMYGVALDNNGNYLLLGGSGDEYPYSATGG